MPDVVSDRPTGGSEQRASWAKSPLLQAALIAAVTTLLNQSPALYTAVWSNTHRTNGQSPDEVKRQQAMWKHNKTCGLSAYMWHPTDKNVSIDATICPGTGDILVSARDDRGKMAQYWPSLDPILGDPDGSGGGTFAALESLLASPAHASIPPSAPQPARRAAGVSVEVAQNVICQAQTDPQFLRRKIATPNGCFIIVINTFTGQIVQQYPAPCSPGC